MTIKNGAAILSLTKTAKFYFNGIIPQDNQEEQHFLKNSAGDGDIRNRLG